MDFDFNKNNQEPEAQGEPQPTAWQDATPQSIPAAETQQAPQAEEAQSEWQQRPFDTPQSGWNIAGTEPSSEKSSAAQGYASYEEWQRDRARAKPESAGANVFSTYEEWQRQQGVVDAKPKKSKKRLFMTLGGICAACLLLAAGVGIGSTLYGGGGGGEQSPSLSNIKPVDPSKPSVSVTDSPSTTGAGIDDGLTGEQIYDKVSHSVVSVVSASLTTQGQSSGSGVIMSTDGYVITNHHVIDGAQKVTIVTADKVQYNAEVVGSDEATDLAVLRITDAKGVEFVPAEFGDSAQIKAGQRAYAIGSPGGIELANTITSGSISAISRDITIDDRVMTLIQTDASINPGNSGGALINPYGQVIGITSAKLGISYYEGLGFAIPMETAKEIVDQLIQHGYVSGRPAIGISGANLSKEVAAYNNVPQGVLVQVVDSRGSAAAAGLQINDIIIGVDGKTITTMDEVNEAKGGRKAGDKMTLTIYRISTGKTIDITITLADEHDLKEEQVAPQEQPSIPYFGNGGNGYW